MTPRLALRAGIGACALLWAWDASAQQLTLGVEALRVEAVGDAWTGVTFRNSYTAPVVACTYNLPSRNDPSAIARIRNVTAGGMEVRAQLWEPSGAVAPSTIHCLVVEEGVHTLPDGASGGGHVLEARRVLSDATVGLANNWPTANYEDVTSIFTQTFPDLVVLGSVMSANDPEPSAFATRLATSRQTRPTSASFLVGKHIGQISGTRLDETLGVIATSPGAGSTNGVDWLFGVTPNSIQGVGTGTPPWTAAVAGDFDTGIATQNAENGGQGGFAVLFGNDPLPPSTINLAIDEETLAGDTTRTHIEEEVAYALFASNQTVEVEARKEVVTPGLLLPGDEVDYTLLVGNTGTAPTDPDTLFLVDALPGELALFTGDLGAPGSGPVELMSTNSGLALDASGIAFSDSVTAPGSFAACAYSPVAAFDPAIRHLCLRPSGQLRAGSLETVEAVFRFRARIR